MQSKNKILIFIASLILILVFFLPIWKISLSAPQYPEGLGLMIFVNKVTGENPNDLRTINSLNHYIGMKTIENDSIPELKVMPFIFIFFILSGFLITWKGNKKHILLWIILFVLVGIAGLVDFYLWEYDYGHNLSPDAPIKVPGLFYQPPFIGTKQLLNITATSLPSFGSLIIFISICLAIYAYYNENRLSKKQK
ncbi:MAG: hypothetical protein N3A61_08675 [Ignavibacteria bacterium]|nr:hypothetical protein [Ignavibacteria bacterium]